MAMGASITPGDRPPRRVTLGSLLTAYSQADRGMRIRHDLWSDFATRSGIGEFSRSRWRLKALYEQGEYRAALLWMARLRGRILGLCAKAAA
jgi:hypothetical protein